MWNLFHLSPQPGAINGLDPGRLWHPSHSRCTTMGDPWGLFQSFLGFFAQKPQDQSAPPTSLRSQLLDAYLQHDTNDFDEIGFGNAKKRLKSLDAATQHSLDWEVEPVSDYYVSRRWGRIYTMLTIHKARSYP